MMEAYNGTASQFQMVGRYQLEETLAPAVSVGIRITLKSGNGTKDYLLLRAIPSEVLKKPGGFRQSISLLRLVL